METDSTDTGYEFGHDGKGFIPLTGTKCGYHRIADALRGLDIEQATLHATEGDHVIRRRPRPVPDAPVEVTINGQRYIKAP